VRSAESATYGPLELGERHVHLLLKPIRELAMASHVCDTGLGRDREPGWNPFSAEHPSHLSDVRALAAQELTHFARALGELVDVSGSLHGRTPPQREERPVAIAAVFTAGPVGMNAPSRAEAARMCRSSSMEAPN
jgi:hypothetical protein